MTLTKEQYKAFEDIVGAEFICDDPALLDSYTYPMASTSLHQGPSYHVWTPRGQAVILPGSTEEVQAIVRLCNKFKIKFKASSTFWAAMGYPSEDENTIHLDMRRMDRVLEIDEKNMYAIIEPHVIGATLQAEVMKRGLNCHIHGPGCSCSPLASVTSYGGMGPDTIFMGSGDEIMLGVEWVMPDGELIRIGAPGSGLGWFYGEGPGPSLKGLVRGGQGGKGAMGVFTKVAVKLSAWPGPTSIPVKGTIPAYQADLPDNFRIYTLGFPTWKAWADAAYMIWDTGIGYIAHRQFNMLGRDLKMAMLKILTDPNRTLSDLEALIKDPEIQKSTKEMEKDFQFVLAGMTLRDIEWQDKALDTILEKTGGWKVKIMMDDPVLRNFSLIYMLKLGHKNLNLVYAGGYDGNFGLMGPPDYGTRYVEEAADFKKEWEKKGNIVRGGGDCMMGGIATIGGGATIVWENFTCWDPYDKQSTEGTFEFFEASSKYGIERGWGPGMERGNKNSRNDDGYGTTPEQHQKMLVGSPMIEKMYRYQGKIRKLINPNDLGDSYYLTLE